MLRFVLAQGSPVLAALWGILVFREFKNGDMRVKLLGTLMLVLFLCGMAMIGLAPGAAPQGIVSPIRKFRASCTTDRPTAGAHSPR